MRFLSALLLLACSSGETTGQACSECSAGKVCVAGECRSLCNSNADCDDGFSCSSEGYCARASGSLPVLTGVAGNGADLSKIDDGLLITGSNLQDCSFAIDGPVAEDLDIRTAGDTEVEVVLPVSVLAGTYTVTASNDDGDDSLEVELVLPQIDGALILTSLEDATGTPTLALSVLPATGLALGLHTHAGYASAGAHNHAVAYALLVHNHDASYALKPGGNQRLTIQAAQLKNPDTTWSIPSGERYVTLMAPGSYSAYASVPLPKGTHVTGLACIVTDGAGADMQLDATLFRQAWTGNPPLSDELGSIVAFTSSGAAGTPLTANGVLSGVAASAVDVASYDYRLNVTLNGFDPDLRFLGCTIDYAY